MKNLQISTETERQQTAWAFIEANYPNYSQSREIAYINDLFKIVDDELEDGDNASALKEQLNLPSKEDYQRLLNEALVKAYERAIAAHLRERSHKTYVLFGSDAVRMYFEKGAASVNLNKIDGVVYAFSATDSPLHICGVAEGWNGFLEISEQEYNIIQSQFNK